MSGTGETNEEGENKVGVSGGGGSAERQIVWDGSPRVVRVVEMKERAYMKNGVPGKVLTVKVKEGGAPGLVVAFGKEVDVLLSKIEIDGLYRFTGGQAHSVFMQR